MIIGNLANPDSFGCFRDGLYDNGFSLATFAPYLTSGVASQQSAQDITECTPGDRHNTYQELLIDCVNLCREFRALPAINDSILQLLGNFLVRRPDRLWFVMARINLDCFEFLFNKGAKRELLQSGLKAAGVEQLPFRCLTAIIARVWREDRRAQLALLLRWISFRLIVTDDGADNQPVRNERDIREAWGYIQRSSLWDPNLLHLESPAELLKNEIAAIATAIQQENSIIVSESPPPTPLTRSQHSGPAISGVPITAAENRNRIAPVTTDNRLIKLSLAKTSTRIADQFHMIKRGFE